MKRAEKEAAVLELQERLKRARSVILTDFRGLSVAEITELRSLLRKASVDYHVVKNTLARLATQETELRDLRNGFEGPTAIALGYGDPIAPTKILTEFAKTRSALQIKGGYVERRIVGQAEIHALSQLPPREVLLARLVGGMQGSLYSFVSILKGQIQALITALDAIRAQRERSSIVNR